MSEWLSTNGLGSYASGTKPDRLTRRYHGLLVAALQPPLGRRVLLSKFDASVDYAGTHADLSSNQWHDGTIAPRGDRHLVEMHMDGRVLVCTYVVADATIERRVWMEHGAQRTNILWTLVDGVAPLTLHLKAYVNDRDYHALTSAYDVGDAVTISEGSAKIRLANGTPWYLHAPGARFEPSGQWYYGFFYDAERERGLDDREDLYHALTLHATLSRPGDTLSISASLDARCGEPADPAARDRELVQRRRAAHPHLRETPPWVERLATAADAFLVRRTVDGTSGMTVIAGYHWFGDWGRDTMIALPGLTLATGRADIAREILGTFARTIDRGMIPNNFPDDGAAPEYNAVDAPLWFVEAVRAYHAATRDRALVASIFDALHEIIAWYTRGTRYGISVDPNDGLLRSGEPGVQLTWMDAKVGDWVVTPRIGKAIEINALWYNALCAMDGFAQFLGRDSAPYRDLGSRARASFGRFWNASTGYPFDVLDGPEGNDSAIRPNAIFAVSLPFRAFDSRRERSIVERAGQALWTPAGLRSLAPAGDPAYCGRYEGSPHDRDSAYHRGTVWPFLAGPFARAHFTVHGDRKRALRLLEMAALRLDDYGVGFISEIADGDPPHAPRGCIAQAWSVAETLRAWYDLSEAQR